MAQGILESMQEPTEKAKVLASETLDAYLAVAGSTARIRAEIDRRDYTERAYLAVKSCPQTYIAKQLALPGRSIAELLAGAKRFGWTYRQPGVRTWANNEAPESGWVYLNGGNHPNYPSEHDSKGFFWSWWVPIHDDVRAAWMAHTGQVVGREGLGSLNVVRRDGSDLLTAEASTILGSTWLTINEQ